MFTVFTQGRRATGDRQILRAFAGRRRTGLEPVAGPPAALSVHLAIGQVSAWSVFKKPLETSLGISGVASALPFTLGIVMLGLSAALFGTKVDSNGPRWAMFISMCCFYGGFLISALGVSIGQYGPVVLGYGVVGGIGLGIGYISPVSTLITWFPDRPGLATGITIMGFGGGALIASPWSSTMLTAFGATGAHPDPGGIAKTFLIHGVVYAVFMSLGWLLIRVPAQDWKPAGREPTAHPLGGLTSSGDVAACNAIRTPSSGCCGWCCAPT